MDIKKIIDQIETGTSNFYGREQLSEKIAAGKTLRVKLGADPSSPDLHLGHWVVLRKLREFQELGHVVDFVIGDFTAMIGDPSGKSKTRPVLTKEQVLENAKTYRQQIFKVLLQEKTNVVFNSTWSSQFTIADVIALTQKVTLAQIIERDDFMKRFRAKTPISFTELLYPLLQAIDSVKLETDIELGGTDQTFNLLLARDLQREYNQEPQAVLTMPLLEGLDGVQKMSKSLGNAIAVEDSPRDMYGKVMSLPDTLILRYFSLLTVKDEKAIKQIETAIGAGENPKKFKEELATTIVANLHSIEKAEKAAVEFKRVFASSGVPDEMPDLQCACASGEAVNLLDLLMSSKVFSSRGEARRMMAGGGVYLNNNALKDVGTTVEVANADILRIGKRHFFKLICK